MMRKTWTSCWTWAGLSACMWVCEFRNPKRTEKNVRVTMKLTTLSKADKNCNKTVLCRSSVSSFSRSSKWNYAPSINLLEWKMNFDIKCNGSTFIVLHASNNQYTNTRSLAEIDERTNEARNQMKKCAFGDWSSVLQKIARKIHNKFSTVHINFE